MRGRVLMVKPAPAALANLCPTPELLAATWQASSQRLLWFDGDGALLAASDAFLHSYGEQGRLQPGMALEQLITMTAPATLSQLRNPLALSNPQPSASLQLANGQRRAVAIMR